MAEYAKYRLWKGEDEEAYVSAELAALLWVLAILDELKSRGVYEDVAESARTRHVSLNNLEVKDVDAAPRARTG